MKQIALCIAWLLFIVLSVVSCGGERDGVINTTDCREEVNLDLTSFNFQKLYKDFVCIYERRASGRLVSKVCSRVGLYGGLLYGSDKCRVAYTYSYIAPPDPGCTKEYPYAGTDRKCYMNWHDADINRAEMEQK